MNSDDNSKARALAMRFVEGPLLEYSEDMDIEPGSDIEIDIDAVDSSAWENWQISLRVGLYSGYFAAVPYHADEEGLVEKIAGIIDIMRNCALEGREAKT